MKDVDLKVCLQRAEKLTERKLVNGIVFKFVNDRFVNYSIPGDIGRKLSQRTALRLGSLNGIEKLDRAKYNEKRDKDAEGHCNNNISNRIFHNNPPYQNLK